MNTPIRFEDLIEPDTCGDSATIAIADEASWATGKTIPGGDIVRVEEIVTVSWHGVSSCDHSDRIQAEVRAALQRWMQAKLYEHRDWRYLRAGAKASTVRCRQWKEPWSGKRSCGCSGGIPFWIEFAKP